MTDPSGPTGHDSTVESHRLLSGRYRLGDVLGRSLMSEVRRGEDTLLLRPIAIKLLRDDGDPRSVARFEREAQILARLHHPNVVAVYDTGVDGADRFIVMELIEGLTLRELLDNGPLAPEPAAEIAGSVASALAFAHTRGIVHRDVKPGNVLLPREGGVKLVDMGIARLLSAEPLTLTMTALGTARYMSPEQARAEPLDGRSDVYSLGCVLFEMLTGRTPFDGNPVALSYAHTNIPAPRVRSINTGVPSAMDELVAAMLEKDAADRPQRANDVRRALAAVTHPAAVAQTAPTEPELPPAPTARLPAGAPPRPPRRAAFAVPAAPVALGTLLAVILLAFVAAARPDDPSSGSRRSPRESPSPAAREPSSPEPSLVESPSLTPEQPSPEEAAAVVLDAVGDGIEAGDVTGHIGDEIDHKIDEILRDLEKDEDPEKSVEAIEDLRGKVTEALEKGEVETEARASAIDEALLEFERALLDSEG